MQLTSVVVLARTQSLPALRTLESLARLKRRASLEVVVVNCCGEAAQKRIADRFPEYTIVSAAPTCPLAQARFLGVAQSRGDIVATVHERYTVNDSWLAALEEGHRLDAEVVGGPVAQPLSASHAEWAMFLIEYAHAAAPMDDDFLTLREAMMLPGGNISYKRRVFEMAPMQDALWELDFHQALYRAGARFRRSKGMLVEFATPYTLQEYLAERRRVSRDLAALRARGRGTAARVLMAAAWLTLPPLLILRTVRRALAKPGLRWAIWGALPWVARFSFVQTAAEIQGIFTGAPAANESSPELRAPSPR